MASAQKLSAFTRLSHSLYEGATESRLTLSRNLAYGGAATCLAILVQILQVGASSPALTTAVYAVAIGIPGWLLYAVMIEYYIGLGERSYPHLERIGRSSLLGLIALIAGLSLVVALGAVVWHLVPDAVTVLLVSTVVAVVVVAVFHLRLARWWYSPNGPGSGEHGREG